MGCDEDRKILAGWEEKNVSEFCSAKGLTKDEQLHCAHFISHVISFKLKGRHTERSVGKIGKRCKNARMILESGRFENADRSVSTKLLYICKKQIVVTNKKLKSIPGPQGHIAFLIGDDVWHYENITDEKVAKVKISSSRIARRYGAGCTFCITDLPAEHSLSNFSELS